RGVPGPVDARLRSRAIAVILGAVRHPEETAMILGVHHPALAVPSIQKALDFYCGVLGFKEVMTAELPSGIPPINTAFGVPDAGCKVRMNRKGNSCIELFEFNAGQPGDAKRPVTLGGITHF